MSHAKKAEAPPKVVKKQIVHAKRSEVFDAWTKPDLMRKWFFPPSWSSETDVDLRVGGRYSHVMIDDGSGMGGDDPGEAGARYWHKGEYLEITPPERLVFTWTSHAVDNTRVTVELRDLGESTEVILTHEFLPTPEERANHDGGWTVCLSNLERFLTKQKEKKS
jgi:uncharacterized protein YndB with AHSA1/START domain